MGSLATETRKCYFRHLSLEELQVLNTSLEKWMPNSSQIRNIITLKLLGRFDINSMKVEFYIYEEEGSDDKESLKQWFTDPFILCEQIPNTHSPHAIFIRTPSHEVTPKMASAFEAFVNWNSVRLFPAAPQTFFNQYLKALCQKHRTLVEEEGHPCDAYFLDHETAMSYEGSYSLPGGIEISSLRPFDATQMLRDYDKKWIHSHTQTHFELAIKNLSSCGVFVNGELATFAVLSPVGLLNNLATESKFRRRGFGVMVLKALGRKVAEIGVTPRSECTIWNDASRQLQLKSGYRFVEKTNWVLLK